MVIGSLAQGGCLEATRTRTNWSTAVGIGYANRYPIQITVSLAARGKDHKCSEPSLPPFFLITMG